ncbi:MAG: NAD(P)H-hydrate dehydratase [Epsilonproteobacteria bacterium]|nr:NAD(P)H-hydrate dehydratase [Campylobacterota bacterium]
MQNLFEEVGSLDQRCYEEFGLSEDLLMEHAADGMADFIRLHFPQGASLLIISGSGNNGADGITLARILHKEYDVKLYLAKEPKSPMARLQYTRAQKIGVNIVDEVHSADIIVDAVLGTGFRGEFDEKLRELFLHVNSISGYKIACDVPSGWHKNGTCEDATFKADTTLTMGALKLGMFLDEAKDYMGDIQVVDLGVSREIYEKPSVYKLLDLEDLTLPRRTTQNTHKGSFGHSVIVTGEKIGAGVLAGLSALRSGSGLVTLLTCKEHQIPYELMQSEQLPHNTTAMAVGMGLGNVYSDEDLEKLLENPIPKVCDADIVHHKLITKLLTQEKIVLTPHPKEFVSLLLLLGIATITIEELQNNRFSYVKEFTKAYPHVVLLLKGANVIIAHNEKLYINPHGSSKLAKGGSGDVLGGIITAYLAQGYAPLEAAINGSLLHVKAALGYEGADYSLTPLDLIQMISKL